MPSDSDKLFLLTNDDGYDSPGIISLAERLKEIGSVSIVAPISERSASSHSVSLFSPIKVEEVWTNEGIPTFAVEGTPADCIKLGVRELLERTPDMIISGINNGENTGFDIHYSGTVSAAVEGAMYGIPSIAVSVPYSDYPRFDTASDIAMKVITKLFNDGFQRGMVLNLNIPNLSLDDIKGVRITRQSDRGRGDYFEKIIMSGRGGVFLLRRDTDGYSPEGPDIDRTALLENFVSLTPLNFNKTHDDLLKLLNSWDFKLQ